MRSRRDLGTSLSVWILLLMLGWPVPAPADVTVRECIAPSPGWAKAYRLPPSSGWTVLGTLEFNHQTTSDYIANVMVELTEGNTPNTRVEYQILLDGVAHGWYTRRVPERFRTTQILRSIIANVPGGIHTLGIQARNLSSSTNVYYSRVWISPLLVEGSETRKGGSTVTPASVGTSWTTLFTKSITTPSDRMNYLAGFVTITGGTPLGGLEYRFLRGSTEIDRFLDSVPDVMSDGVHLAHIDRYAPAGTNTYHLQARITSGTAATAGARSLHVQTMPKFTVFEGVTTSNVTVPSDGTWKTVSSTPWQQLSPASVGSYGTDGSGFAHVTHTGAYNYSGELRFHLELLEAGLSFEVGWLEVHPVGQTRLMANQSDWEQLGLNTSGHYRLSLQAKGACSQPGATQMLARTRFQVAVIPDSTSYTFHPCSTNPSVCCANNYPSCLVYKCTMSSSLQVVSVPVWNCQ